MELEPLPIHNLKYRLFASRRFLPMFLATFLGTFNDNVVRSGLVVLIAYAAKHNITLFADPEILVTLCSALLVLPMVLFSSVAGQLADKCDKARLVVFTKIAEVLIMLGVAYGFYSHNVILLMGLLFISGTHTTFCIPIKFSILPQHLNHGELLAGNGFIASGSYLAILTGMIAGGLLVDAGSLVIGAVVVGFAISGLIASLFIPPAPSPHPETVVSLNLWRGSMEIIRHAMKDRVLMRIILVLSWFIVVGSVFIAQIANYTRGVVHADNKVYIIFLTIFSLGMAAGSLICDTALKGQISTRLAPISAIGVALFTGIMVATGKFFLPQLAMANDELLSTSNFFMFPSHLIISFAMFMVALCGGVCMVPLYAAMQVRTSPKHRSQIIAASNLSDSVAMTAAAVASVAILSSGLDVQDLFMIVAAATLVVALYARKISA